VLENNHVLLLNSELRNIHQTQRILLHVAPRLYVMSLGKACLLFTPRKLSQTVNTSDLYVGGFGSKFGQNTDCLDTVSVVVVSTENCSILCSIRILTLLPFSCQTSQLFVAV
jgi:hypothetical protein